MKYLGLIYLIGCGVGTLEAARLKDIASLRGMRGNTVTGYGLVVGLSGTGDKSFDLTTTSLSQVLRGLGIDQKDKAESKNAASVLVTAVLPPFARVGGSLDVTLASIGSATSLEGGTLMMTSLRGADGLVYAMAQGKTVLQKKETGGGGGAGKSGTGSMVTVGVPNGATIEKELPYDWSTLKEIRYQLYNPDFTTAARIAHRINEELAGKYATALDAGSVEVIVPYSFEGTSVDLVAQLESVDVESDRRAKVVINPRTGTVVLGDQVRILPVALAQGNLRVEIKETPRTPASSPGAEAGAGDAAPARSDTKEKKGNRFIAMPSNTSIADLAASLNEMGASPDDLLSLLQSLKAAGALLAELEIQ